MRNATSVLKTTKAASTMMIQASGHLPPALPLMVLSRTAPIWMMISPTTALTRLRRRQLRIFLTSTTPAAPPPCLLFPWTQLPQLALPAHHCRLSRSKTNRVNHLTTLLRQHPLRPAAASPPPAATARRLTARSAPTRSILPLLARLISWPSLPPKNWPWLPTANCQPRSWLTRISLLRPVLFSRLPTQVSCRHV